MLRIIPLGGLGEFGLNAMVLESGGERILVDCGLMFPSAQMPGVGVVQPDLSYLFDVPERLRAVLLTHGHEDHVGALPTVVARFTVPVYGLPFTLALARGRLEESGLSPELRRVGPREPLSVGERFSVEFVRVVHSMPDAAALVIRTPEGTVIHTGDFKLDEEPVDGLPTDLDRLSQIGDEGVLCLLSDSTGAELEAPTPPERTVERTFEELFSRATGRIVVSMFASNVHRLRHTLLLCARTERKVVLAGRSLSRNVELARQLGLMDVPANLIVPTDEAHLVPRHKLVILATGSQAEPRSALVQMIQGGFGGRALLGVESVSIGHERAAEEAADPAAAVLVSPALTLMSGDLVILSSRAIPGNERMVGDLIDRILERGATVVYGGSHPGVHVSGHGTRPHQREMIQAVRPTNFVPIHGELRHLYRHLELARESGLRPDACLLARNGDVLEFHEGRGFHAGEVRTGRVFRDRWGNGEVDPEALAEREKLAELGVLGATLVVDLSKRQIASGPHLIGRGLSRQETAALDVVAAEARQLLDELSPALLGDEALVREELTRAVRRAMKQRTGKRPTVLATVVKV
jgi:ribonuclease J